AIFVVLNCAMNIYMKWLFSPSGGNFALPWTMLAIQQLEAYLVLQPWLAWRDSTGRFGWGVGKPRKLAHRTGSVAIAAQDHQAERMPEVQEGEEDEDGLGVVELCQVLSVTGFFCLNVGLNSLSLVRISITLNQTVRAFLPVGVLLCATCIERRTYPRHSYITTLMLVLGIALTCWGSPNFEPVGFTLALASTFVAAIGSSLNGRLLCSPAFRRNGTQKIMQLMMLQSVPAFVFFAFVAALTEGDSILRLLQVSDEGEMPQRSWLVILGLVSISSALALVANLARCFLVAATSASCLVFEVELLLFLLL
ncbi:unnamed protein product, partial [Polarella glacialis]